MRKPAFCICENKDPDQLRGNRADDQHLCFCYIDSMLDHPITVVLNVFDTLKNNGLKVYKFMSIQPQEEHIGHIKQSKSDRFQYRYFFLKQNMVAPIFSQN